MELSPRLKSFVEEVEEEQQKIQKYLIDLKNDGILDDSLEIYLKDSFNDLQFRKEKLVRDLAQNSYFPITDSSEQNQSNKTINGQRIMKKPSQEPVSFVKDSKSDKNLQPVKRVSVFHKKTSPERGNSPSARRYSPQSQGIYEKKKRNQCKANKVSPACSTRSSRSSEDKFVAETSEKNDELWVKYEELREIRNKAHEKMLMLKERMLVDKEIKINKIIQKVKDQNEKCKKSYENIRNCIRPPRSPREKPTSESNDKIVINIQTDLVYTISGIPKSKVNQFINLVKHKKYVDEIN
jgi:hypothetical protein